MSRDYGGSLRPKFLAMWTSHAVTHLPV